MDEARWLAGNDPHAMLNHLLRWPTGDESGGEAIHPHHPGDRKLRLFACACWRLYHEPLDSVLIHVAEQFADGMITREIALSRIADRGRGQPHHTLFQPQAGNAAINAVANCRNRATAAALLRCIVGDPWRPVTVRQPDRCPTCTSPSPELHPAMQHEGEVQPCRDDWHNHPRNARLSWLTPAVLGIAQAAYDQRPGRKCLSCDGRGNGWDYRAMRAAACARCNKGRVEDGTLDPVRFSVLADAVEDAGCDDDDLLANLRTPGPHVRGCWVVDLFLGKV